jgi:UDP-N-acetyl-2-amino-2-deoxyglucuronate dehydrogenase
MRIGIIGAGNISDTHARAASAIEGVEVVAVYGHSAEKTAALAKRHRATSYPDLDQFLSHKPMDIVAIGSPSGVHAEQALAAIRRGLHVLVEKPLDITSKRIDQVIEASDRAGVKVGVFFQDRLTPDIVEMKSALDGGAIGTPVLADARVKWYRPPEYYSASKWRGTWALDGGGALMNQGIHTVDLLLWLLGPVRHVSGRVATRLHKIEVEDTAVAALEFKNGALATIEASTAAFPGFPRRVEVTGSKGTLILEHDSLLRQEKSPQEAIENVSSPVVSDASPHRRVLEDFIAAIRTNGTPACDAREGRRSVALVEAVYRSAASGKTVKPD